jgi:type IV pilus assembly protein PilN
MARINLLPWRETLRRERQREFGVAVAGGLIVTVLLGFYVHLHVAGMIDYQNSRNAFLKREIAEVDKKIAEIKDLEKTKARLLARMNVIQQLQASRPEIVHLFDELVTTTPEGVFLTKIEQKGDTVTLFGNAQSNARVSAYMRNVEASQWITNPVLQIIENKDKEDSGFSQFTLTFQQKHNKTDDAEGKIAEGGGE